MLKVLLVDDEAPILNHLSRALPWKEMGMEVAGMARSGMEALVLAEAERPDVVLCDIRMPVMDGLTFIGKLRDLGMESEVLLLTGYQEFDYAREAIRLGVKAYISKPIQYEELGEKLQELGTQIRSRKYKDSLFNSIPLFHEPVPGEGDGDRGKRSSEQMMNAAAQHIGERLGCDLALEEVAGKLGISGSYFCLLFKNHFGMTFIEYVTQQRMEAAKFLLANSGRSISSIGSGVGYHERRYFSKVFQRHTGMAPKEYREKFLNR